MTYALTSRCRCDTVGTSRSPDIVCRNVPGHPGRKKARQFYFLSYPGRMPGNLDRQSIFGSYPGRGFLGGALTSSNKSVPAKTVCNGQTITPPWGAEGCRLPKPILVPTRVWEISAYMGLVLPPAEMPRPISYPGWENLGRGMSGLLYIPTPNRNTITPTMGFSVVVTARDDIEDHDFYHSLVYWTCLISIL